MRIRMLSDRRGADDGFTVRTYFAGKDYEFSRTPRAIELAQVFVREGWAELLTTSAVSSPAPVAPPPAVDPARDLRPVYRLPLIEEYVAAGRLAENYAAMIEAETKEAELAGMKVEVRARNTDELAEEERRSHFAGGTITTNAPAVIEAPPAAAPTAPRPEGKKSSRRQGK